MLLVCADEAQAGVCDPAAVMSLHRGLTLSWMLLIASLNDPGVHAQPAPPQILHKIGSKCSLDEMIVVQCEVVHKSKALLPPECAFWQPPSLSIDMLRSCCPWYAQKPTQEVQLDLLKFVTKNSTPARTIRPSCAATSRLVPEHRAGTESSRQLPRRSGAREQ